MFVKHSYIRFESLDGLSLVEKASGDFFTAAPKELKRALKTPVSAVFNSEVIPDSFTFFTRTYEFKSHHFDTYLGAQVFVFVEKPDAKPVKEQAKEKPKQGKISDEAQLDLLLKITLMLAVKEIGPLPEEVKTIMEALNGNKSEEAVGVKALVGLLLDTCHTTKSYEPLISAYPAIMKTIEESKGKVRT